MIPGTNNGTYGYGMVNSYTGAKNRFFGSYKKKSNIRCMGITVKNKRCKRFSKNKVCHLHSRPINSIH